MATGMPCPPDLPAEGTPAQRSRPPPSIRRERSEALEPLTETQREFAAANHALIFSFLRQKRLKPCEFYDIAAMGYLDAVRQYTTRSSLTRYQFSTIAWRVMGRSVAQFFRAEERRL